MLKGMGILENEKQYVSELKAGLKEFALTAVEKNLIMEAKGLVDGDKEKIAPIPVKYGGARTIVFDLGVKKKIYRIDIVGWQPFYPKIRFELKTSNAPDAKFRYYNGLMEWEDGIRHVIEPDTLKGSGVHTYYFLPTEARYIQMVLIGRVKGIKEVIFYE